MTAVFEPVREARRLWLRTDDQLSLEVDDLTTSRRGAVAARLAHNQEVAGSIPAGAIPTNQNGSGHAHSEGARVAGASQERS